ncbi:hypothetical protein [Streptomyces profundus]|uniref:hypothetical protein n=1 Tax=Streptomyces profundus TaxID=2867410 RepID=UPI001D1623CE|nr:hypothetical protein [Streptomyces sp. MA3_2.13]UED82847.1 hypothetical protein K4G22_00465 [Streptomyces sp. MA3_2.13]
MSGDSVSWPTLGVVFLGVWIGVVAFTDRERGPVAVIASALGTQALLHVTLSLGHVVGPAPAPAARPHPAPGDAAHAATVTLTGAHEEHGSTAWMLAAHLALALLSAVWLWWGERALFRLLGRAADRVWPPPPPLATPPTASTPPRRRRVGPDDQREPPWPGWARRFGSRGPPPLRALPAPLPRPHRARPA